MFFCKWFSKKQKLKFVSTIPGMENIAPPIHSRNLLADWKHLESLEFSNFYKQETPGEKYKMAFRCPGMFNIQTSGWIIRSFQDINIKTKSGVDNIEWSSALNQKVFSGEDIVSFHTKEAFADVVSAFPKHTHSSVVKINTGWKVIIPDGYFLLQLPLTNFTENRFTAVPGSYSYKLKIAEINVPLLWHELKNDTLIEAGTPLCQLILVKSENPEFEITTFNKLSDFDKGIFETYGSIKHNKFVRSYKNMEKIMSNVSSKK